MTRLKLNLVFAVLASAGISGCYARLGLYPVGNSISSSPGSPQSVKISVPAWKVMLIPVGSNSANASASLSDGELCKGQVSKATPTSENPMVSVWDAVYGSGYYVAHVLGSRQYAQAVLSGNRGTTLTIQMYSPETGDRDAVTPPKGIAKDNHGNIYKLY